MVKSMTGFGRSELSDENFKITVEIKSVNHRYLDTNIKMPKKLNFYDSVVRNLLKKYIERGKVDIYISYEDLNEGTKTLSYDGILAKEYAEYIDKMSRELMIENDITVTSLLRCPDIFTMKEQEVDEEEIEKVLTEAVKLACDKFVETRRVEGENLKNDLLEKLEDMIKLVDFVEEKSPLIIEEYKKRITEKIAELMENSQVDDSRVMMEVTLFADKICIDEELVRLRSHVTGMKETLLKGGSVGRKLDFVAQEMNREANTILSKSTDLEITDVGIELKTLIEKVREQIQNIE